MNPIDYQAKWLCVCAVIILALFGMAATANRAHSAPFYPACLKSDGDWLHGVTSRECRSLGGQWYTARVLKKARRVW